MPRPRTLAALILAVVAVAAAVVLFVVDDDPGLRAVRDATGGLTVEVPDGWSEFETRPLESGGRSLPYVQASPDLDAYRQQVDAPGLEALLVEGLGRDDVRRVLEETAERLRPVERCTATDERRVAGNGWEGLVVVHSGCGAADTEIHLFVLAAPSDDTILVLGTQALANDERDRILDALTARAG